jgi:hypothetical protein
MSIWDTLAAPLIAIVNKCIPDKAAAAAATAQLQQMATQGDLQTELLQLQAVTSNQTDINKAEAVNGSVFVSGWRPMIGWVCASALAYQYVIRVLAQGILAAIGHPIPALPVLDDNLWQLMFGMLGMGGLRTFEKVKGVASK